MRDLLPWQQFITAAAIVTIAGQFVFLFNLFWEHEYGKKASDIRGRRPRLSGRPRRRAS